MKSSDLKTDLANELTLSFNAKVSITFDNELPETIKKLHVQLEWSNKYFYILIFF